MCVLNELIELPNDTFINQLKILGTMAVEKIEAMVEGGKASAGPPLGPALGPMGVNIGMVISKINERTALFKGMQVPIKVLIQKDTKEFEIEVGTPPASALIKKEAKIEKGSGNPKDDKIADILIEQCIKVAKMKEDSQLGKTLKQRVKEIVGTCNSMGVMVEGVPAVDAIKMIEEGKFDAEINAEKTELSAEELRHLEEEKERLKKEMETRRHEFEANAKSIIEQNAGKSRAEIKGKLKAAKIPDAIIAELLPAEAAGGAAASAPGAPGAAAPAAGAAAAKPAAAKPAGKK